MSRLEMTGDSRKFNAGLQCGFSLRLLFDWQRSFSLRRARLRKRLAKRCQ
jgi:hypothetical protein